MPRRARLDAPGTLHHVMVRGIERRRIGNDVADCKNFVERLGELAAGTKTTIYAWALISLTQLDRYRWSGYGVLMGKIKNEKVSIKELRSGNRRQEVSGVRALIAIELVKKQGVALAEVARRVGISTAAVSKIIKRARQ